MSEQNNTTPKNILIFNFPFHRSNPRTRPYLLDLALALKEKGYFFHLYSGDNNLTKHFQNNNFKSYKIWVGREPTDKKNLIFFLTFLPITLTILSSILIYERFFKKCKILFCLSLTEKLSITPIAKLLGYKIFWLEENFVDKILPPKSSRQFIYHTWSKYALIIPFSDQIKEQILPLVSLKSFVKVIKPGLDLKKFPVEIIKLQSQNYQGQFVIGTICRLKKESGLAFLLKALSIASEVVPNLHLIIIGEGPEKKQLFWLANQLGVSQKVRFIGWQDDLARWINNFDLYVFSSLVKESFGLVLLEIMALAKPIIATKTGTNPEIVEHGKTGLVIEPQNPEMLAQAIINLYNHPQWLEEYGFNARKRIEQYFDLDKAVEQYELLFK